jgi:endonuclease/exonuclease/phosphatase family metal-dependent hydrolase
VRLVTFNVLHGRSPEDDRVDLDRFGEAIRRLDADVLALQEVDRGQPRSAGADLTAIAAEAGGYRAHRFAPALEGLPGDWRPATDDSAADDSAADAPQYGVALLSRLAVRSWQVVRLPALPGRVPVLFPGRRRPELVRDEPRVAVAARLDGGATVVSTHLSFLPWWNRVQLRTLVRRLPRGAPLVLMGDLNLPPDVAVRSSGLRPLAAGPTFPAHAPVKQIDHLLGRGFTATSPAEVRCLPVSDHCALCVDAEQV